MDGFALSYSVAGEDILLRNTFGKNRSKGLYVDIGCNLPIQFSNTFKLYLSGWDGICVDGNENLIRKFRKIRKRDICIPAIVSNEEKDIIFYQSETLHTLSTVDPVSGHDLRHGSPNLKEITTRSTTLAKIFEKHVGSRQIDLLCVDVENHDLEVLKGNDFTRFRPEIICVEFHGSFDDLANSALHTLLTGVDYDLLALSSPNAYYRKKA